MSYFQDEASKFLIKKKLYFATSQCMAEGGFGRRNPSRNINYIINLNYIIFKVKSITRP